ncbi:MAG: hypothetical protein FWG30_08650 [Eubacteriaceae bacterium]|nr:hypothetical protein [Eubacteriaceae bacterium]
MDLEKTVDLLAKNTTPVYSLKDCLKKAGVPDEMLVDVYTDTITRFRSMVYVLNNVAARIELDELSLLTEGKLAYPKDASPILLSLLLHMYVFAFKYKEALYIVMPDELRSIYEESYTFEIISDEERHLKDMSKYAIACLNLYGVFDAGLFVEIWNKHHIEKINIEEAVNFFIDNLIFLDDYYIQDGYIISTMLDENGFNDLLDSIDDLDIGYYMPTKSVINTFGEKGMEYRKTKYFLELEEFIESIFSDAGVAEEVLSFITYPTVAGYADAISDCLEQEGFPFDDEQAVNAFEKKYESFYRNMRDWDYGGYTATQVSILFDRNLLPFKLDRPELKKINSNSKPGKQRS